MLILKRPAFCLPPFQAADFSSLKSPGVTHVSPCPECPPVRDPCSLCPCLPPALPPSSRVSFLPLPPSQTLSSPLPSPSPPSPPRPPPPALCCPVPGACPQHPRCWHQDSRPQTEELAITVSPCHSPCSRCPGTSAINTVLKGRETTPNGDP